MRDETYRLGYVCVHEREIATLVLKICESELSFMLHKVLSPTLGKNLLVKIVVCLGIVGLGADTIVFFSTISLVNYPINMFCGLFSKSANLSY